VDISFGEQFEKPDIEIKRIIIYYALIGNLTRERSWADGTPRRGKAECAGPSAFVFIGFDDRISI